jgi:hypothetical protein
MSKKRQSLFSLGKHSFGKVRLKDGWGSRSFVVKGTPPKWLAKVEAEVLTELDGKKSITLTVDSFARSIVEEDSPYKKAGSNPKLVTVTMAGVTLVEAMQFRKNGPWVRKDYYDLFFEIFEKPIFHLLLLQNAPIRVLKDGNIVGVVAPLNPTMVEKVSKTLKENLTETEVK